MIFHKRLVGICSIIVFLFSCQENDKMLTNTEIDDSEQTLFSILSSPQTNIDFRNDLNETMIMNGLRYEYFYNGAGVAVGDLNNDGLVDIYFNSNLKSNKLYLNKGNMKFEDVTDKAGVNGKYGFPTGVTVVDLNGDGLLDLYICKSGRFTDPEKRRNELYINQGNDSFDNPIFKEMAKDYNLDLPQFSTQAAFFDYDKDGDLDMFLINHGIDVYKDNLVGKLLNMESELQGERLYRNDEGIFIDVTIQSGIINNMLGYGLGLGIGDINNDGWSDVIVGHDYSEKDHIYLNQKDGKFKEVVKQATNHISNFSMGNDIADINNDGWMEFISLDMMSEDNYGQKASMSGMNPEKFSTHVELGLHHQYMYNTLQLNNGLPPASEVPKYSDIGQLAGISSTDWSWGPLIIDMDNDGMKDLFISNGIKRDFRNNDFLIYYKKKQQEVLQAKKRGASFDQKAFVRDVMSQMPERKSGNYFYRNENGLNFSKKNSVWAPDIKTSSNGAAYADFDNDGDLDIVINNSDDFAFIYKNNSVEQRKGNYLKVRLLGYEKNRDGIGARVILESEGMKQVLEQNLTRGFQSSSDRVLHFGLGDSEYVDKLKVIWPDGSIQTLSKISSNQLLLLDYKNAERRMDEQKKERPLFVEIRNHGINHEHKENAFNDFQRESLLPHKLSQHGPALAVGDINGDSLDDVFVGGALGYPGAVFIQNENGKFEQSDLFENEKEYEDVSAKLFDADHDGDLDLYVASGGNEREIGSKYYRDRFYENVNGKFIHKVKALPFIMASSSCVKPFDYDSDGDLDLFVGGRQIPGKYPFPADSYLLENRSVNGKISFVDISTTTLPNLKNLGMVTDAVWVDVNGDGKSDLVVVGEWMAVKVFINNEKAFEDQTQELGLSNQIGWWSSVAAADFDNDGDMDLIAGNLGLNYKYKATPSEPFEIYTKDFDENGNLDIVLGYYNEGDLFPLRGRECTSNQMPFVKQKFATYDAFGKATLMEVYGEKKMQEALHYKAKTFATTYFENKGNMSLAPRPLNTLAQVSSVNTILIKDINQDQNLDLILAGNMFNAEVETPRNDASYGILLLGDGKGSFEPYMPYQSGLYIYGDIRSSSFIQLPHNEIGIAFGRNNDFLNLTKITKNSN